LFGKNKPDTENKTSLFGNNSGSIGKGMFGVPQNSKKEGESTGSSGLFSKGGTSIVGGTGIFGGDKGSGGLFSNMKESKTSDEKKMFGNPISGNTGGSLFQNKTVAPPLKVGDTQKSTGADLFGKKTLETKPKLDAVGGSFGGTGNTMFSFGQKATEGIKLGGTGKEGNGLFFGNKKEETVTKPDPTQNVDTKKKETVSLMGNADTKKKVQDPNKKPLFENTNINTQKGSSLGTSSLFGNKTNTEVKPKSGIQIGSSTGSNLGLFKSNNLPTATEQSKDLKNPTTNPPPKNPLGFLGGDKPKEQPQVKQAFSFKAPEPSSGNSTTEKKSLFSNFGNKDPKPSATQPPSSNTFNLKTNENKTGTGTGTGLFSSNNQGTSTQNQTKPVFPAPGNKGNLPFPNTKPQTGLNIGTATKKQDPTIESIQMEKFQNKRVLEIQTEWEEKTREIKHNLKKLGVLINQNEDDLRKTTSSLDQLKASQLLITNEHKFLNGTLDKILVDQNNMEAQLDLMDRELDAVLSHSDMFNLGEGDEEDLFAQASAISKSLAISDKTMEQFTEEINTHKVEENLDSQFTKAMNNYFESLNLIENDMGYIDGLISNSFGRRQFA
jgi:hypothetical protein